MLGNILSYGVEADPQLGFPRLLHWPFMDLKEGKQPQLAINFLPWYYLDFLLILFEICKLKYLNFDEGSQVILAFVHISSIIILAPRSLYNSLVKFRLFL